MSNTDNNKRIARNTLYLYIRMGIVLLISLYTTRVVLRVLGAEDYGIYNVVCGFVAMFGIFNSCFSTCLNRFYNYEIGKKTEHGVRTVYNTAVLIQLVLAVSVVLLIEIVGSWYINNVMVLPVERVSTAKWIFHFSMISMFLTIMQAPYSAAIMSYEKMDYYAIVSIFDVFLKLGFVIMLKYVSGDKLLFYGVLLCVIAVVNFLMYFIYCRLNFPEIRLHRSVDKSMMKSMLSFAGWSTLDPATYMARDQGTNMVLNSFFGTVVNAAQGIAYQIAAAVDTFGGSFSLSFRPQMIQSYSEGQYNRTKNLMISMSKISFMLHAMIIVPIILEIHHILLIWLGDDYPAYASVFTILILCVKCIGSINSPISTVVSATGNIKKMKIFSAIVIASVVPISIILFNLGCPPTIAYVVLLGLTIINQAGSVVILHQVFPYIKPMEYFRLLIYPLLIYTVCTLLLPLSIVLLCPSSIWRLVLVCISSIFSAICFGYFIILNKAEKDLVSTILNTFRNKFFR